MIDEKFFKEQLSALKGHIDARVDGLEKRMETTEGLLKKIWIEVEAIRGDIRLIAEGHVML
jgi:hypothetical protein